MGATDPLVLRTFAGGEISPALAARADTARYASSLRTCYNAIVQRHGGVSNRAGTRFAAECKTSSSNVKLIPFLHEDLGSSVLIEAGNNYLRFHAYSDEGLLATITVDIGDTSAWSAVVEYEVGDLVNDGGDIFYAVAPSLNEATSDADFWAELPGGVMEIPTPFDDTGLFNWHQSGRTITLTHKNHPPHELIYQGPASWVFREIITTTQVPAPENPALAASAGTLVLAYVITAIHPITFEESEQSSIIVDGTAAEPTTASPRALSWDGVTIDGVPCEEYFVYKDDRANGTFGYIGTATGQTNFNDPGIIPDFSVTPPLPRPLFDAEGLYPHVSATYQQRRVFAQTEEIPDAVYCSRVGYPSNFGISSPLQDDDAVTFRIAGNNNHPVRSMVALKHGLCLFTEGGEWTARGPEGRSIIPNGVQTEQETYVGAGTIQPVVVGNGVIYGQARGSKVAELRFDQQVEGLGGRDLTVFAGHLFDGYTIRDMAHVQSPDPIVWVTRSDGALLGMTYIPELDVWGWHLHETDGSFERLAVMPGDGVDDLFVIVSRTIGGSTVRYIEKLEKRTIIDFNSDAFFVDSGLSYSGAAVSNVSGLDHLEGEEVAVVGDGAYLGLFTVAGGAVSFGTACEDVHAGLPFVTDLETLSLDVGGSGMRAKRQRVAALDVVLDHSSRAFFAGRNFDTLKEYAAPSYAGTARSHTGKVELTLTSAFDDEGRVCIRQTVPLPITVLAIIPHVELSS